MKPASDSHRLDRWAIIVSSLCIAHCLAIPATVLLLPALSSRLSADQTLTHWLLLAIAVPISLLALGRGYRHGGAMATLALGLGGLALLVLGVLHWLGHETEMPLTIAGGALLIAAHWQNLRHRQPH